MKMDRLTYSRYQIICAEREAWFEETADGDSYHYDGISFWHRNSKGKQRLVPSWRTPSHGWRHAPDCDCDLCSERRPVTLRPLSVA